MLKVVVSNTPEAIEEWGDITRNQIEWCAKTAYHMAILLNRVSERTSGNVNEWCAVLNAAKDFAEAMNNLAQKLGEYSDGY